MEYRKEGKKAAKTPPHKVKRKERAMIKGIDLYTRIILTVIAICLVYIVAKDMNIVPDASAQRGYKEVPTDVNIVRIDGQKFGPSDVNIFHPALPIKIINNQ